jgi:glycosyltransferase involved in cell wall biosynthesis
MRVAHFVQRFPPALGGSEAYFARLSRYLAAAGDQVTVFTTAAVDLEAFWRRSGHTLPAGTTTEDRVEVRRYSMWRWPARRFLLKPLSLFPHRMWQCLTLPCNPIAPAMWRDAGAGHPPFDVVHATAFPYAWPIACGLRLARRQGVPFCLTPFLHLGDPANAKDPMFRAYTAPALLFLARAAQSVFVQTELERRTLSDLGIPEHKLVLLGMGVDPAECTQGSRQRSRRDWGVQAGEVVVGHLANNSQEKGTVDLLLAAAALWKRGRKLRVVLAGPEMANFRGFWNKYQARGPMLRLGVLDDQQKRDFFAGLDIFALPSRSDSFGLVLLEAWANRLPNVAYKAGGVAEVIRHDVDGLLVPCGSIESLADTLGRLILDEALRSRLAENGWKRIAVEFRWQEKLSRVRQVYENLTGAPAGLPKNAEGVPSLSPGSQRRTLG